MAQTFKIDSHTWVFEDDFVRFFLLEGVDKAVMIDTGANCPDAFQIAKTFTDKPIMLLNTHGDGDHTSGTDSFSEIHMHSADYINCGMNVKYPKTTLMEISDGEVIELGNRPLRIIYIPGHTKGSVAVLDVKNRVLYSGDTVQKGNIYMFGAHRDTEQYEAALDKLISISDEYDVIYASHDELILPGNYAENVKMAWNQVRSGEIPFEVIDLFGNKVKAYKTDVCGFYLNGV